MEISRGDFAQQYNMLTDYILELQRTNPDTTVKLDVESEANPDSDSRQFKRIYVCLGALKKGFKAGKRELLGLDGVFMEGPFPGQILIAVGLDPNHGTYLVAYGIVEAENTQSWSWFLECLAEDLGLSANSNFTFISDRKKGMSPAIAKLFPSAEPRYCLRHIHEDMKQLWKGKAYKDHLVKCATATTVPQFERAMDELKRFNSGAHEWLKQIHPHHWSRSHFTGVCHSDISFNTVCEIYNKELVEVKDKPIITVLEYIRVYLMKRIVNVQKVIDKSEGPLTPTITKKFDQIKTEALQYKVLWNGGSKYQVSGPWPDQCVVNIDEKTCSCRRWELTGIPCKHVVATLCDMSSNGIEVGLPESWVHPVHWLSTWKGMYTFKIDPINGPLMWPKSNCPTTLTPPKPYVEYVRPEKRKESVVEMGEGYAKGRKLPRLEKTVTCDKCKEQGHNSMTCKGQVTRA